MRINKFVAQATGLSRRAADAAITEGRVLVNRKAPEQGQQVAPRDLITLDGKPLNVDVHKKTIMLHKPVGYVCSRDGQGSKTVYDLLPTELHHLKPVGRLDKDSSGLLLMSNDGELAHQLTHPSFEKNKEYEVKLDKPLTAADHEKLFDGVSLEDGLSRFEKIIRNSDDEFRVSLHEGKNRQIRRTFAALGYKVIKLHRVSFGPYILSDLTPGKFENIRI